MVQWLKLDSGWTFFFLNFDFVWLRFFSGVLFSQYLYFFIIVNKKGWFLWIAIGLPITVLLIHVAGPIGFIGSSHTCIVCLFVSTLGDAIKSILLYSILTIHSSILALLVVLFSLFFSFHLIIKTTKKNLISSWSFCNQLVAEITVTQQHVPRAIEISHRMRNFHSCLWTQIKKK